MQNGIITTSALNCTPIVLKDPKEFCGHLALHHVTEAASRRILCLYYTMSLSLSATMRQAESRREFL